MTSEEPAEATTGDGEPDERTVSVLGTEVVLEEAFVAFPWRAGMARAPATFVAVFVVTTLLASIGGFGEGTLQKRFALLGIAVFSAHNIPAATGAVPEILAPIAEPVVGLPGIGALLRGLFTFGAGHAAPIDHFGGILAGETDTIGHLNIIEQQGQTIVPAIIYYLLPPLALFGAGYEFADSYWAEATTESATEVVRFGLAIAMGYLVVLLVGSVLFTTVLFSPLTGAVTILPDRYLLVVFGLAYPTIFGSLGAAVVYVQRGPD